MGRNVSLGKIKGALMKEDGEIITSVLQLQAGKVFFVWPKGERFPSLDARILKIESFSDTQATLLIEVRATTPRNAFFATKTPIRLFSGDQVKIEVVWGQEPYAEIWELMNQPQF